MKRFTKMFLTLALLFTGVVSANAEKVYADLSRYGERWDGTDVTFSWNAPWGNQLGPNLSDIGLPTGDLRSWEKLVVVVDELTDCDYFRILVYSGDDTGHNNTFRANKTGANEFTLSGNVDFLNKVTRICLSGSSGDDSHSGSWDTTPSSFKVKEVYLERPDIIYIETKEVFDAPEGTIGVNDVTEGNGKWNIGFPQKVENETLFGGNIDGDNLSIDITDYDYLHFIVSDASTDANCGLRVFLSTEETSDNSKRVMLYPQPIDNYASVSDWSEKYMITTPGTYVLKVSDYPLLRGFKALQGWAGNAGTIMVSDVYLSKGDPVAPTAKFSLVGSEALSDATATCFDVTGVSGSGITLDAANPNALFIANEGTLANTKNVIVDGVCANLELTDKYPFMAPAAFTATAAKFTKTVDSDYATMLIPFGASVPSDVEAYEITGNDGDVLTTNKVESVEANKPVMLKNNGTFEFTAEGVEIAKTAEAAQNNGLLNGVYAATAVPTENTYVLQKQGDDVNFYKAISGLTINPFRAYLTTAAAAARLTFDFNEATGIKTVKTTEGTEVYNLQGVRVANPTKGLYIVNGKKVIK